MIIKIHIKDIWSHRSNLISSSDDNIKIIHFIRHPYEIICSGVKYHKICTEAWCINNNKNTDADGINYNFNGLTYQKKLQSLNTEDSVNFEMEGRSYNTILDMYNCKFNDYNFCLNVKMEDIYTNLNNTCIKI